MNPNEKVGRPKRPTIIDVANAAGVSRQTVSRAVNGKGEIDPDTKRRVMDAVAALGYRPSRFGRGLVRPDTVTIGLVISDLTNPFYPEVAVGVLEAAERRGWQVVVYDTGYNRDREIAALGVLTSQVDAVIGYFGSPDEVLQHHSAGVPLVLLDRRRSVLGFASVRIDVEVGVREALRYLFDLGHRRIGMLDTGRADRHPPSERSGYFLDFVRDHQLPVDESWVIVDAQSVRGGESGMAALLAAHPDVTAVFAFNDLIAVGALRAAKRLGVSVPDGCAVIGFDGLTMAELVDPALTTMAIDKRRLGELAVEQVARLIGESADGVDESPIVRPQLIVRESS